MAYQQSPGLEIKEKDASAVTVGLSSTIGATVGEFNWGPVDSPQLVTDELNLVATYGKPTNETNTSFLSAANFLTYTNSCWVNRVAGPLARNATASGTGLLVKNYSDYENIVLTNTTASGEFVSRYPGVLGSGLKVSIADAGTYATWEYRDLFSGAPGTSEFAAARNGVNDELHMVVIDGLGKFNGTYGEVLEKYEFVSKAANAISYQGTNNYYAQVLTNNSKYAYWLNHPLGGTNWGNSVENTTFTSLVDTSTTLTVTASNWAAGIVTLTFAAQVSAPYTPGAMITVSGFTPAGYNGTYTVVACTTTTVTYALATTPGTSTVQGSVVDVVYDFTYTLTGGVDDNTVVDATRQLGWDAFADTQTYDISLLVTGNASIALSRYVVQNIADIRKDCVVFVSITASAADAAEPIFGNNTNRMLSAKAFKSFDSTFAVIDSGYKYMYDKYNDKYRWIALNADVAGLCARVDITNDPWHSPAGLTKGQIKNVVKLSWNPNKAERDILYPAAINSVINMVGQGTMLFGDRTATTKPSAFDKINVRRLFLILEKSISNSAKYQLFELNDEITRLQFIASIEPFLRDVKGRRGMDDYRVICDETNNTPQVIASNSFVGSILIKPKYSINFLTLNFTAVGPDVTFEQAAKL